MLHDIFAAVRISENEAPKQQPAPIAQAIRRIQGRPVDVRRQGKLNFPARVRLLRAVMSQAFGLLLGLTDECRMIIGDRLRGNQIPDSYHPIGSYYRQRC